jgi:hypothetical protein
MARALERDDGGLGLCEGASLANDTADAIDALVGDDASVPETASRHYQFLMTRLDEAASNGDEIASDDFDMGDVRLETRLASVASVLLGDLVRGAGGNDNAAPVATPSVRAVRASED